MRKRKKTDVHPDGFLQSPKHPVRRKLMGCLLCVCLITASMPVEYAGYAVQAAENSEVLSYSELPEERNGAEYEKEAEDIKAGTSAAEGTKSEEVGKMPELAENEENSKAGEIRPDVESEPGEIRPDVESEPGEIRPEAGNEPGEIRPDVESEPGEISPGAEKEAGEISPAAENEEEPAIGTIGVDTVWTRGSLENGTLTVESGVTLTITGRIAVNGNVTVEGGGKILRGAPEAYFEVSSGTELTFGDVLLEGNGISSTYSMIDVKESGTITLDDGCVIQNCRKDNDNSSIGGAALCMETATAVFNNAVIENCWASSFGGAVCAKNRSQVTVNGGTYRNNRTILPAEHPYARWGGGFLYAIRTSLYIYGGRFLENSATGGGGCIYHEGAGGTETHVYGGYFQGNTSSRPREEGSGVIWCSSEPVGTANFNLSGDAQFYGGGTASGMDGIYFDMEKNVARRVRLSSTLNHPVTIYLEGTEGYVIAEGYGYTLQQADAKRLTVIDSRDNAKTWYTVLDAGQNQIYLSSSAPEYGCYITYITDGANGEVSDDTKYEIGDDAWLQSGEELEREGYTFFGWNTKADGTGSFYRAGDRLKITGDLTLYAVFLKNGQTMVNADFYSGQAGQKETKAAVIEEGSTGGTILAPELAPMEGFWPVGWELDVSGFEGAVAEGTELTLTEHTAFYGVYEKEITLLFYDGQEAVLDEQIGYCRANVHDEITYRMTEFDIPDGPKRENAVFVGWNTKADGTGSFYQPGSSQSFDDNMILYAIWNDENEGRYRVEHYKQESVGEGYQLEETDIEYRTGAVNAKATAQAKVFPGFTENISHPSRKAEGTIAADGTLVLRLYYDRNTYEVRFDLNGGQGETPGACTIRYGGLLPEIAAPKKTGYNFKGWYMNPDGTPGNQWDFGRPPEAHGISGIVTLYAKWADETAPVLGEASVGSGYQGLFHWMLQKKGLTITVPVLEEGSGVRQAEYTLIRADGSAEKTFVRIQLEHGQPIAQITVEEDFQGIMIVTCTDCAGNTSPKKILTIDGKGNVVQNNAPEILFAIVGGGLSEGTAAIEVSVRDEEDGISGVKYKIDEQEETTLPQESFGTDGAKTAQFTVLVSGGGSHTLTVTAEDKAGYENTRQILVDIEGPAEDFSGSSGSGTSGSRPWGGSRPGGSWDSEMPGDRPSGGGTPGSGTPGGSIPGSDTPGGGTPGSGTPGGSIPGSDTPGGGVPGSGTPGGGTPGSGTPGSGEPGTGEVVPVEIYATVAMIAGFTYLLLYFVPERGGMTEKEKILLVHRLVRWANEKGSIRRFWALAGLFLVLVYYHSIGKAVKKHSKDEAPALK